MSRTRAATAADMALLVDMMAEFDALAGYALDRDLARTAFATLLADDRLGRVWILLDEGRDAGYLVLTLGYSMEYGGRDAFVDDLYVREAYRNRGLGGVALDTARAECERRGVRALHLEVARDNAHAQALYRRTGFVDNDRQLLTLRLAETTHFVADEAGPPVR